MIYSFLGLPIQQVSPICMSATAEAVHVFAYPDVSALCQPVFLKVSPSNQCDSLNQLYNNDSRFGNYLGSCSISCTQAIVEFTHQQFQFTQHFYIQSVGKQSCQQHCIPFGALCLGFPLAMTTERLSEALQRVAKAKTSPLLPKAFVAFPGGPIVLKLIALRCPPKTSPERPIYKVLGRHR